jgi:type IV secretory pathway VirB2 component (pilin)
MRFPDMHRPNDRRRLALASLCCVLAGLALVAWPAFAQGGAAPWEGPICVVARSLSGPVAKAVAVIAIVITGLMIAFGELGGVFKSLLGLVFGVSFALLADQWLGLIRAGASTACFGS